MQFFGFIALALILGVGLIAIIGAFLPKRYEVGRMIRIPGPVDKVWRDVSDPRYMSVWRKDLRRVLRIPPRYKGLHEWHEIGWMSKRKVRIKSIGRSDWVGRAEDGLFPTRARLRVRVQGNESLTLVEVREDGVIRSPFVRFLARFVIGVSVHPDAMLRALGAHYGAEGEVEATDSD